METFGQPTPPRPGFFRRLLSWRGALFLLAALITLVALFWAEENWRGARAWQNYKRTKEAGGEYLDPAHLIPPAVPDDLNLATIHYLTGASNDLGPMTGLTGQFKWPAQTPHPATWPYGEAGDLIGWAKAFHGPSGDTAQAASTVYDSLQKREPVLAELQSARKRPYCRFNLDYNDLNHGQVNVLLPQLARIRGLVRVLALRAQAELVMGKPDQALDDLSLIFRLQDGLKDEPLIISQLVRLACCSVLLQPLGEGLAEHRWSDAQLRVIQEQLQRIDPLTSTLRALRGERDLLVNPVFDAGILNPHGPNILPRGWVRLEQLNLNRAGDEMLFPRIDLAARVVSPRVNHSLDRAFKEFSDHSWFDLFFVRHRLFAKMLLPPLFSVPQKAALTQSELDLAAVSCALERCRLAEGHYPEQLIALAPRFMTALPHDVINGQPLKYRRTDDGRFILYSVGWNDKDDRGVAAQTEENARDRRNGDWVWEYPPAN